MAIMFANADDLLRGRDIVGAGRTKDQLQVIAFMVAAGLGYGAAMGTYGGFQGDRIYQIVYSAAKLPLLLGVTFLISLPSFFVLNSLLGVRSDFSEALRALCAAQAVLTLVLVSLAPYTLFWYASFHGYNEATLFNAAMFLVATVAAQIQLRRRYRPLVERHPVHRRLLVVWLFVYAFVGIQMAWILRPFIGAPNMPVQFFRDEAFGNAYVVVGRMIWRVLFG